ncbi:MAG: hypothetical protein JWQ68_65 [Cryobacterium sp.]|jgi:hypothetical protein|nr:hypothetical protein [Cryobacterium sp.]
MTRLADVRINRRTALGAGLATVAALALPDPVVASAAAGVPANLAATGLADAIGTDSRYLFSSTFDRGAAEKFTSLEALWADGDYLHLVSCEVSYIGDGPHVLTPAESAIVAVAEKAGGPVADRGSLYRTALATCTRIQPAVLDATLAALGVPVVRAAVAFAPYAPQARQLTDWLGRVG